MVRTADSCVRTSSGKSSKKAASSGGGTSFSGANDASHSSDRGGGGLNPVCHRETPAWQKPITTFFVKPGADAKKGTSEVALKNDQTSSSSNGGSSASD